MKKLRGRIFSLLAVFGAGLLCLTFWGIFSHNIQLTPAFFLFGLLCLIFSLAWGGHILYRSIITPIARLNQAIGDVKLGNLKTRLEVEDHDEFGQLEESFNLLVERLTASEEDARELQELQINFNNELMRKVEEVQQKHNQQLRLLMSANRLSTSLISTFDPLEIMKLVLESLRIEFGFEQMVICLANEEKQTLDGRMGIGLNQMQILKIQLPWEGKVFEGLMALCATDKMEKAFQLLNDEQGLRGKFSYLFSSETPFFILPLMAKNHLRGLLVINQRPFSSEEILESLTSLKMLANQTALALENTSLYSEVNRVNVNLSQRIEEIGTLNEIGQLLNSILDMDDLLELFIYVVTKEMKAEIGSIMLINKATHNLTIRAAKGLDQETIKNTCIHLGEGISGWVALHKKPLLIKDIEKDLYFGRPNRPKYETKSLLCAPIISREEAIGVVNINNRLGSGEFTENDLEFLKTLANQAAISLENAQLYENLQKNYYDTIKSLVLTLEAKDPYTKGHSQRVTEYVMMIAQALDIPRESLAMLEYASILHDIGKIGISEFLLSKNGKLTTEEYERIQKHPIIGESIIEPIEFLSSIRPVIRHHHERYDGHGYPDHLQGEDNSLEARILSIADAYDAMTTDRPYRKGLKQEEAIMELIRNKGTQFDGVIVDIFVNLLESHKIN